MSFFTRCISGNSLRGMVRDDDDDNGSGSATPNDTAHGGSKFSSYSWKRLSAKSRSSLNSPKRPPTPPLSATSADGTGPPRASMEPVMERTRSALTDLEAVKFLVEDWSHKYWRPATPQDQERFERLEQSDIKPLVALGEGAYGSVNLCRIAFNTPGLQNSSSGLLARHSAQPTTSPFSMGGTQACPGGPGDSGVPGTTSTAAAAAATNGADPSGPPTGPRSTHRRTASAPGRHLLMAGSCDPVDGTVDASAELANGEAEEGVESVDPAEAAAARDTAADANSSGNSSSDAASPSGIAEVDSGTSAVARASVSPRSSVGGSGAGAATTAAAAVEGQQAGAGEGEVECEDVDGGAARTASSSATDPQLIVAVKRVPLGWNQERELMQLHRCQQCPFIVRLFGFVEDGTEHCSYVMEWAEGGDLGVMLSSLKSRRGVNKQRLLMSEISARYYMGCLMLALEFLHAHGLLHRDIKPSNLLLTSDGTAKLADLGFTVALDGNGRTVGCCGTTGYIAPEVFLYGSAKSRMGYGLPADIWSAGATLYQILTGQVVTDHPEEVLKKGWRPPTHPRFSPQLQDLLNRMLAVKPTARPQSVASVMRHGWFAGFDWQALRQGRMKAPYVPSERRRRRQSPSTSGGGAARSSAPAAVAAATATGGGGGDGPPTSCPGGQRLAPVLEGASTPHADSGQQLVVQRSALSGQDEGSVKRGRDGLVRNGSSFETALGTVSTAETQAGQRGGSASCSDSCAASGPEAEAGTSGATGSTATPRARAAVGSTAMHGRGHGHGHVRFAVGVAECA